MLIVSCSTVGAETTSSLVDGFKSSEYSLSTNTSVDELGSKYCDIVTIKKLKYLDYDMSLITLIIIILLLIYACLVFLYLQKRKTFAKVLILLPTILILCLYLLSTIYGMSSTCYNDGFACSKNQEMAVGFLIFSSMLFSLSLFEVGNEIIAYNKGARESNIRERFAMKISLAFILSIVSIILCVA